MKFTKTTLKNGLRVFTVPMPENGTVTAMVLVEAGSRYETKEKNGISHFLEHMCFKGTVKRPSALAITTEFESLGVQYNAFTSGIYTGYYAKASKDKGHKILEMVSDLYLNATLPEEEIEREKGVVIEEINMINDQPERLVWQTFDDMFFPNHPAGRPIIGNKDTVKSFSKNDLQEYRKKHYIPGKTIVVVAGNIDEKKVLDDVSDMFGTIPEAPRLEMEKVTEIQKGARVGVYEKQTDQTHFILGFRTFNRFDPRKRALGMLATILGQGMSSRLFHRIREELGLCYYISASTHLEGDHGVLYIRAGVAHDKIEQALKETLTIITSVGEHGVTEAELQKAKDFKIGNMYLALETSDSLADWYAFQEIDREEIKNPEEIEVEMRAVTKEEVQSVAKEIFDMAQANLAAIGPHKGKEDAWKDLLC
jgi:predicted Zn-dependent peptidase